MSLHQRKMLDRGVWLEFDMIGLDITFPKRRCRAGVQGDRGDAVANLIAIRYADQIVLSYMMFFLKTDVGEKNGGNGWGLSRMSSSPIWLLAE